MHVPKFDHIQSLSENDLLVHNVAYQAKLVMI